VAFAATVRLDLPWGLPKEEKEKSIVLIMSAYRNGLTSELAWLGSAEFRTGLA